jgi:hypothetical protein
MAGRQDESLAAGVADHRGGGRLDHPARGHRVVEAAVGDLEADSVPAREVVDVAEVGTVGGPVPGHRDGAALARQVGVRVVARAVAQVGGRRALYHHRVHAAVAGLQAPHGTSRTQAATESARPGAPPFGDRPGRRDRVLREGLAECSELIVEASLLPARVERREGLLPQQGDPGVGVIRAGNTLAAGR